MKSTFLCRLGAVLLGLCAGQLQAADAASSLQAKGPQSFSQAKRILAKLYTGQLAQKTLYCGCDFAAEGKRLVPELTSCGYQVRKQIRRASRIEWEHVMPAWQFGHQRQCWQQGGRGNCRKDPVFKTMEADLHNLYPTIGEVNGDRSNYRFSDWNGEPNQYGQCDMLVDFKGRKVQPTEAIRGQLARVYLYMAERYALSLSDSQAKLMQAWHHQYPPQAEECQRHRLISQQQGWPNPYLAQVCPVEAQ